MPPPNNIKITVKKTCTIPEDLKLKFMFEDFMNNYEVVQDCLKPLMISKGLTLKNPTRRHVFRFLPVTDIGRKPVGVYFKRFMCSNTYIWKFKYNWVEKSTITITGMDLDLSDIHIKTLTQHELIFECYVDSYSFFPR